MDQFKGSICKKKSRTMKWCILISNGILKSSGGVPQCVAVFWWVPQCAAVPIALLCIGTPLTTSCRPVNIWQHGVVDQSLVPYIGLREDNYQSCYALEYSGLPYMPMFLVMQ